MRAEINAIAGVEFSDEDVAELVGSAEQYGINRKLMQGAAQPALLKTKMRKIEKALALIAQAIDDSAEGYFIDQTLPTLRTDLDRISKQLITCSIPIEPGRPKDESLREFVNHCAVVWRQAGGEGERSLKRRTNDDNRSYRFEGPLFELIKHLLHKVKVRPIPSDDTIHDVIMLSKDEAATVDFRSLNP